MNFKNNNIAAFFSLATFLTLPAAALAINFIPEPNGQILDIPNNILLPILSLIWPIVVTVVVVLFILAGFKFLNAKGEPSELQTARRYLIWAIGGVIVVILAFSIVNIIKNTFQL